MGGTLGAIIQIETICDRLCKGVVYRPIAKLFEMGGVKNNQVGEDCISCLLALTVPHHFFKIECMGESLWEGTRCYNSKRNYV